MTKTLLTTILLLGACFSHLFGQNIANSNPSTATAGSAVTLIITGANTNFTTATGAYIYATGYPGGFIPATNFTPSSNTVMSADFSLPPNAPLGGYTVGVYGPTDLGNGLIVGVGPGSNYGYISGNVNHDYNSNCVIDPGDLPLANRVVSLGNYSASTDVNGFYSAWLPLGNYPVTMNNLYSYELQGCIQPGTVSLTVPLDSANNTDISIDTINVYDMVIHFPIYTNIHRPGFQFNALANVQNIGLGFSNPTTGYFVAPDTALYTAYSFSGSPASINGDTAFYNIPSLPPYSSFYMGISGTLDTGTLGLPVMYHAEVMLSAQEYNQNNNYSWGGRTVGGSFDPNDKQVWTQDNVNADGYIEPSDSLLRYLIRFQNTGTDTAFNIFIRDTMDLNLDMSTLTVEDASHNWTMSVSGQSSVQWTFPNILLVDSVANEPLSHGYISYSIKRKPGLPIGTQIDNTAHIYFDFNSPVVTNTVSSTICPEMAPTYSASGTGNTLNFTATASTAVTTWQWDFGDGNSASVQNPTHTYSTPGFYNVCLYATNSCGRIDTTCQGLPVNCITPTSAFSSSINLTAASFSDLSSGAATTWLWDFGDGNSSTSANPSHTYAGSGTYTVCLIAGGTCGADTSCQTVTATCPAHTAGFSSSVNLLSANFTNSSAGGTTYLWTFGDGNSSTAANPSHSYAQAGTYTVCLVSTNSCDSDSICQTVTATCLAPGAAFNNTVSGPTASFTDQTAGNPSSWLWTFGDGGSSTLQNPVYTYTNPGTYTVCLIATNNCDADTSCLSVTIACAVPNAAYGNTVNGPTAAFTDLSSGAPTAWYWTFGDGGSSAAQNPSHTYQSAGTYTVCLVATSICGSDSICNSVTITCATPFASFSAQQLGATISFNDQTNNTPTLWAWDFGDGNSSTLQNPSHTYTSSGSFTACLIASNSCGSDTNCLTLGVVVGLDNALVNRFDIYPNPTSDRFVVDLELNEEVLIGFSLYNLVGAMVQTNDQVLLAGSVRKTFDVSNLPAGMYMLEMRINGQSRTWKVMVGR